jgi:hypothetical protein
MKTYPRRWRTDSFHAFKPMKLQTSRSNPGMSMNWKSWTMTMGTLLLLAGVAFWSRSQVLSFDHLDDVKSRVHAVGYYCAADVADERVCSGFLISREPVSVDDAGSLCKAGRMGPEWRGRVWVTISPSCWQLQTVPDGAEVRRWGAIIAFGDGELLSEIDRTLDSTPILF